MNGEDANQMAGHGQTGIRQRSDGNSSMSRFRPLKTLSAVAVARIEGIGRENHPVAVEGGKADQDPTRSEIERYGNRERR